MAEAAESGGGDLGGGGGGLRNFWGNDPADEEGYYAGQNISATKSLFTSPSTGLPLFTRSWLPLSPQVQPRAVVFMVHGYGNDVSWTFQSTPIFLAQHGFACFALDLPGHGRSHGLRAFVPDLHAVVRDCLAFFASVADRHRGRRCFLYGESMGGALCLLIHLHLQQQQQVPPTPLDFNGAVLVAPMCRISDKIRPPWPLPGVLTLLAAVFPTLPVVPTADLIHKSVKVEEKKAVAASNPLRYNGRPRLGTVVELLRATDQLAARLQEVTVPLLILHGSADEVTDPEVSRELYDKARSDDKTIKMYPGMMHSLLFGETDDNVDTVRRDILEWLIQRCA